MENFSFKKIMCEALVAIILIGVILGLTGILGWGFSNFTLDKYDKELSSIGVPEKTEIIEKKSLLGKLNGSGSGMQYFSTILIKTELTEAEIFAWYDGKCDIASLKSATFESMYLEHDDIYYESVMYKADFSGYYVISMFHNPPKGLLSQLDVRGH